MDLLGIVPIRQKFLQKNYLFGLEFREGWIFGRTTRVRVCQYKPYPVIDANGTTVDINASSFQTALRLRDSRNTENDILYLEDYTHSGYAWFYHGALGIKPQFVNAYPRFPEEKDLPGKFPELDPIRPSSGDDLGYINSLNSPYEEPTDHLEIVITPKQHIGIEYYNKDASYRHQPVLHILFCLYWAQIFNDATYTNIIRRIALREIPASFFTAGFGEYPVEMEDKLKKEWGVDGKEGRYSPMSLSDAAKLGGR